MSLEKRQSTRKESFPVILRDDYFLIYSIFRSIEIYIDNKVSKKRYRADVLVEDYVSKIEAKIANIFLE